MDLIYKINSIYLYDNQLNHDYLILYNTRPSPSWPNQKNWDLSWSHSEALSEIYNMDKSSITFESDSINKMIKSSEKQRGYNMIKNDGFLTLVKGIGTHLPNYNVYDIYWNETKSGINIHNSEVMAIWNVGKSQYSTYRICEEKSERERIIRDNKLNLIFEN